MRRGRTRGGLLAAALLVGALGTACGSSTQSTAKFCSLIRKISSQSPLAPNVNEKSTFQQLDAEIGQILAVTPKAIKADMQTLTNTLKQLSAAMAKVNYDPSKVDPAAISALTGSDVAAASGRIADYANQQCGIVTTTTAAP